MHEKAPPVARWGHVLHADVFKQLGHRPNVIGQPVSHRRRLRANPLDSFMEAAKATHDGVIKTAAELASRLTVVPGDTAFLADFRTLRVSNHKLARYYLLKLDAVDDPVQDRILNPDEKKLDLEHILPENDWSAWLSKEMTPEKAKDLHRRLGNLALCRCKLNSTMAAQPYADKAPRLAAQGAIRLTSIIPTKWPPPAWGEKQIGERQESLAQLALKAWPIKVA